MAQRITIDLITRIEGHLRIDCEIDNGKVVDAWSSGQMWRGIEVILKGRDPRDAPTFTQRICGVCTTVHALASVRAVENALNLEVPLNAQYIRNLIMAALVGTPIADPEKPLEVLRTVHSFDPCLACAIHLVDAKGREISRVKAL